MRAMLVVEAVQWDTGRVPQLSFGGEADHGGSDGAGLTPEPDDGGDLLPRPSLGDAAGEP